MAIRKVESPRTLPDLSGPEALLREYIVLKRDEAALKKRIDDVRSKVVPLIEDAGEVDDKGHQSLALNEEWEGYLGVRRQRTVRTGKDMDAAERILKEKGLWERCAPPVPTLSDDEIYGALYEELLTEEDIDAIYPQKVTYAVVLYK